MKKLIFLIAILISISSILAVDFKSVYFTFWIESITGRRGETINLPINIKNHGVLTDKYTVIVNVPPEYSSYVSVADKQLTTSEVKFNEITRVPVKILFLTSTLQAQLNVTIISQICSMEVCSASVSPQSELVYVRAGVASLPDFSPLGIVFIIIFSSVILYKKLN